MSAPLPGEHADEVAEITQREVGRFARLFADELARTPMRADGNVNARDLWHAMNDTIKRFDQGETA